MQRSLDMERSYPETCYPLAITRPGTPDSTTTEATFDSTDTTAASAASTQPPSDNGKFFQPGRGDRITYLPKNPNCARFIGALLPAFEPTKLLRELIVALPLKYHKLPYSFFLASDVKQKDNRKSFITIGMELEIIVLGLKEGDSVFHITQKLLQELFDEGNRLSIQTEIWHPCLGTHPDRRRFIVMDEKSVNVRVHDDITGRDQQGVAVEIATPILRNGNWRWIIPTIMEHIDNSIDCRFNATTGLHVHIGCGSGWDLEDLKKISKAIVIFEEGFDSYHPPWRQPNHNWCIESNRFNPNLKGKSKAEAMRMIDGAKSNEDLYVVISPHKFHKYNVTAMVDHGTVEFRQAPGNLDSNKAVEWIDIVVKFVQAAIAADDTEFERWSKTENAKGLGKKVWSRFGVPWKEKKKKSKAVKLPMKCRLSQHSRRVFLSKAFW
ncbi:hypothetical protein RUND412_000803 [Rhizina undulata]